MFTLDVRRVTRHQGFAKLALGVTSRFVPSVEGQETCVAAGLKWTSFATYLTMTQVMKMKEDMMSMVDSSHSAENAATTLPRDPVQSVEAR